MTTPQNVALLDATKGIELFNRVQIPVLGVVENMSTHICSNCGFEEQIFGQGGGDQLAQQYDIPLLGRLPLNAKIRENADKGEPSVVATMKLPIAICKLPISFCNILKSCQKQIKIKTVF